jgi:hypothetical protein
LATGLGSVNAANLVQAWSTVVGKPAMTLSGTTLTFAATAVGKSSATQTVTLKNSGTGPMSLGASITSSGNSDFKSFTATTTCTGFLAAGTSCGLTITFTPTTTGTLTAELQITDNASGSPQVVKLTGTGGSGVTVTATLTPTPINFTSTVVGSSSSAQVATLKNTGTGTLTITSGGITITGTDASSFTKTTTCGTTLASLATCTISVTFKPAAAGSLTATLGVADNATGSPQQVTLNGTATATPAPAITLNPTSLSFGDAATGTTSEAQAVTVKNTGSATATLKSITLTGTNPTAFEELNTCGATLTAGASCTVFVAFKPASAGALKASLSVSDTASGSPQIAALTGTGTAASSLKLSATKLTFASTAKATTTAAQTITITNSGAEPVEVTGITLTGTGASSFLEINNCQPVVAAASSCSIDVAFKPAATGSLAATISVSQAGGGFPQTIALSGTGH